MTVATVLRGFWLPARWSIEIVGCRPFDQVDVGPFHLMQELPGVDRQAFDVLPLPFGKQRVEGQRAFARPAGPGDDDQPVAGDVEVDVLQVMHPGAANADGLGRGLAIAAGRPAGRFDAAVIPLPPPSRFHNFPIWQLNTHRARQKPLAKAQRAGAGIQRFAAVPRPGGL